MKYMMYAYQKSIVKIMQLSIFILQLIVYYLHIKHYTIK